MTRLLVLVLLLAGPALAVTDPAEMLPDPAQEARARALGRQLRCLVCQNESIEDSGADLAKDLRTAVRLQIREGKPDDAVLAWMEARYGSFVRLNPPFSPATLLLWGAPVLALGIGGVIAWRARRPPVAAAALSPAERKRLAELGMSRES